MAKKKEDSKKASQKEPKQLIEVVEEPKAVEGEVVQTQPVQTQQKSGNGTKIFCCCGIGCAILLLFWILLGMLPFILPISPMMTPRIF